MHYGVDPGGSKLAIACAEEGWVMDFHATSTDPSVNKQAIGRWAAEVIPVGAVVLLERALVAGARNLQSTIKVAETVGAVQAHLPGRAVTLVAVSSWKKETLGHGGIDKPGIRKWIEARHPEIAAACLGPKGGWDIDKADAWCIALAGPGLAARGPVPDPAGR
jgi:hypothetical protein